MKKLTKGTKKKVLFMETIVKISRSLKFKIKLSISTRTSFMKKFIEE